jgi:hypothetical protein
MASVEQLGAMSAADRSQLVGNFIYPHVVEIIGDQLAPKVTGMCLELPVAELALIMQGVEHLKSAVEQAMAVLPPEMKAQQSPAASTSPTSVLEGANSDRWADADDMEEDGELPPVCDLFATAEERRSKAAAEAEEGAWQVEWDAGFWRGEPDDKVVTFISERLREPQLRIVRAVVDFLGTATALQLLARTEKCQAQGGMLVPETGKARTSGGIYLKLLKDATNVPREAQEAALLRIKTEGKKVRPAQKGRVGTHTGPVSPSPRTPTPSGPVATQRGEFVVGGKEFPALGSR